MTGGYAGRGMGGMLTSAVLGTDSQKTSILMSPTVVWSVTDMVGDKQIWILSPSCCLKSDD